MEVPGESPCADVGDLWLGRTSAPSLEPLYPLLPECEHYPIKDTGGPAIAPRRHPGGCLMNETTVTVVGTVCSEVRYGQAGDDTPIARFQIRNTPRRFDTRTGTWGDGDPSYYSAVCWRN